MKLLQDNLLGRLLAGISGLLLLITLLMAVVWTLPVSDDDGVPETNAAQATAKANSLLNLARARELEKLENYQVINEKPIFNVSRQPVMGEADDGEQPLEDKSIAVRDAPKVRLTGVIITPALRIASLTPAKADGKSVMAYEGQPLVGEYVGWKLAAVHPRKVVLASSNGQSLKLKLEVNDETIKEPPKPVVAKKTATANSDQATEAGGDSGEPLSRAEQIRQRIAARREELRRKQEEQQNQTQSKASTGKKVSGRENYKNAIRALMSKNRKDKSSHDKEEG